MKFLILGSIAILMFATFAIVRTSASVGSADYETVERDGDFEIRKYADIPVVSARSEGRSAFSKLFRYISGSNDRNQKIPMTSPVFSWREEGSYKMSFVLPKDVAENGAPVPSRRDVIVETITAGKFAVTRYGGYASAKRMEEARQSLENWIAENNLDTEGTFIYAGYDGPYTPSNLRRNEVLIRLAK